jgi:protein-L-isoaspartate(D-aspartate) O-methyltransferase
MNMEARIRGIGMTSRRTRVRLANRLEAAGIDNDDVLDAMVATPRHLFVDEALETRAYEDCSLPIGEGQTISQPYVVALMTQLALDSVGAGQPLRKVLEIGTGSGYQAAVLSQLVDQVYTTERISSLATRASDRLRRLGYNNVRTCYNDGVCGWTEKAPFDAIIVTAAMEEIPQALLDQVRDGGVLIGPVGAQNDCQKLSQVRCYADRAPKAERIESVHFVPFVSGRC